MIPWTDLTFVPFVLKELVVPKLEKLSVSDVVTVRANNHRELYPSPITIFYSHPHVQCL